MFTLMTRRFSYNKVSSRGFCWSEMPPTDEPKELEKRQRFWELEKLRESVVDYQSLSEEEKLIHDAHKLAVKKGHFTYEDPVDGGPVETRYKHFLTGLCCGNACRHCLFNFYNVPKYLKATKTFNTSFWRDTTGPLNSQQPTLNLKQFNLRNLRT